VGFVPSTLHQKLKFVVEGHLVIVSGEEDVLVSCPSSMPYVEAAEESLETTFQSFEVVSIASVDSLSRQPHLSDAAVMVARVMLGHGYEPIMGLGKNNDGRTSLVSTRGNRRKFGLGYCRNLPFDGRATRDSRDACSTKGIRAESPPMFI